VRAEAEECFKAEESDMQHRQQAGREREQRADGKGRANKENQKGYSYNFVCL
jgi:hypothetical protein